MTREPSPEVPRWLSHQLPTGLFVLFVGSALLFGDHPGYERWMRSEQGLIENVTVLLCLIGAVLAGLASRQASAVTASGLFRAWMLCFLVGLVWLGCEEVSWGQHWFGWATPESFAARNIQAETNLHNLYGWTEQLPKIALHGAALFAIGWGLWLRGGGRVFAPDDWRGWLMPTRAVVPSAIYALVIRIGERAQVWAGIEPADSQFDAFKEFKEMNEVFLVLFIAVYLASLHRRVCAAFRVAPPFTPQASPAGR